MPSPATSISRATEILELVIQRMPCPNRMLELDLTEQNAIRFTWREKRFRVFDNFFVEEVDKGCLVHTTTAELLQALLRYRSS
jgi:hypothetical protein